MTRHRRRAGWLAAWAVITGIASTCANAQDFYAGKTLNIIVSTGPGGGFDTYGRTVGRHLVRHIPGKPTLVVQNMPGAGGMKATEYIYVSAPDGTTIGIVYPGALVEPLLSGRDKFRFDPTRLEYVGSANTGTRVCLMYQNSKIKTFEDARHLETVVGGNAPGDSTVDYAYMLNALAGAKFKVVKGYTSTAETFLAIERGELDGMCGMDTSAFQTQRPTWYGTALSSMIIQAGLTPKDELTKLGVPSIWTYVTGPNRKVAELILAQQEFLRPFIAPAGASPTQLRILQTAFDATMKDPDFLADAKTENLEIAPKSGERVKALIETMYASPAEIVEEARKALRP